MNQRLSNAPTTQRSRGATRAGRCLHDERGTRELSPWIGQSQVLRVGCLEQLSHAIGVVNPCISLLRTYGTEQESLTAHVTTIVLKIVFEFRHGAIAVTLAHQEPKHQETVSY